MAFWKVVLEGIGGFDPVYTAAGDDVDFCWKVLDDGWDIGFHPAALVWHHRRPGLRAYLRQQRSYGRSEALVEAHNPDRFTGIGSARWHGHIYNSLTPTVTRQRIYRGAYGAAAYQSVYQGGGFVLDLVHQVGVPAALILLLTSPLIAMSLWLGIPAACAATFLVALMLVDTFRTMPPRSLRKGRLRFQLSVAVHHILQPVVRMWGRSRSRSFAHRHLPPCDPIPEAVHRGHSGVILMREDRPRAELAASVVGQLRHSKLRVLPSSGWDDYDARIVRSAFVFGDLQTSSHPTGYVQLRVRRRFRRLRLGAATGVALVAAGLGAPFVALAIAAAILIETARGVVLVPLLLHRIVPRAADERGG